MARGRVYTRPAKKIDFKEWVGIPSLSTAQVADTTVLGGSLAFAIPATILRVRGAVQAAMDSTMQIADEMEITWGLGIISSDAFAAGAGSVPDPAGEIEYPWLWWGTMFLRSEIAAGLNNWGTSAQRLEVDTKAMRKVKPGQSLAWILQTSATVGAVAVNMDFHKSRVLIGT